jgi:hypothetical protein
VYSCVRVCAFEDVFLECLVCRCTFPKHAKHDLPMAEKNYLVPHLCAFVYVCVCENNYLVYFICVYVCVSVHVYVHESMCFGI